MKLFRTLAAALVCALLLNACASLDPPAALETESADAILEALDRAAEEAEPAGTDADPVGVPPGVSAAGGATANNEDNTVLPVTEVAIPAAPVEPDFDLAVDKMPVNAFFQALVADTPYNALVHPGVKGTVSLSLNDVTVSQVMELMRSVYGFDSVLTGNTYQIYPDALRTEI
ncbi:MAG: hypothetical protein AB8B93_19290, partial [Pseudomonadales bacterium]